MRWVSGWWSSPARAEAPVLFAAGDRIRFKPVDKLPEDLDEVVANNVFRRELAAVALPL